MQIKCHFYDILLLCIRIENNQHLFSFVSYVPHLITCNCTKIQPQPNIFREFHSSLMCCTFCACAKGRFSIKSAVLWFGLSQSLSIPKSNGLSLFDFLIWTCCLDCQLIWFMAKVTGVRGRRCLLYLEHLIVLSAGLNSHFNIKKSEN